jgi:hypothetical protein
MSDKFKALAARAIEYEQKMNALIHEKADNEQLINTTNKGIQKHTKTLRWFRQFNELVTLPLNLSTKNDAEGVAGDDEEREENVLSMLKSMIVEEISTAFKTSLRNALEDTLVRGRRRD